MRSAHRLGVDVEVARDGIASLEPCRRDPGPQSLVSGQLATRQTPGQCSFPSHARNSRLKR